MARRKRPSYLSYHPTLKSAIIGALCFMALILLGPIGCIPAAIVGGFLHLRLFDGDMPYYGRITVWAAFFYALLGAGIGAIVAQLRENWSRRRRPIRRGPPLCATCSYNLTGNVSGICPECGTPTKQPESAVRTRQRPWRWGDHPILSSAIIGASVGAVAAGFASLVTENSFEAYLGLAALCVLGGAGAGALVGLLREAWRR